MSIRIVFMGTPDFAVASLDAICKSNIEIVGVITAPDKPAGRGKKIHAPAVKLYARQHNIPSILQPTNLKDKGFQKKLKSLNADLFVVVAFRMLPESVWSIPQLGTINLHASMLPNYRGAAPINWAVINGETETGVSTFFIRHEIDTGNIIDQKKVAIRETDTAGTLHDKLMVTGAELLVKTIEKIARGNVKAIPQESVLNHSVKEAPKIFKEDCRINWNQPVNKVYDFIRGLSPYPGAWTEFSNSQGQVCSFKIFDTEKDFSEIYASPGEIIFADNKHIKIACTDGYIILKILQQAGKKRMDTKSFLLGFSNKEGYNLAT